jgi:hypothetical protein
MPRDYLDKLEEQAGDVEIDVDFVADFAEAVFEAGILDATMEIVNETLDDSDLSTVDELRASIMRLVQEREITREMQSNMAEVMIADVFAEVRSAIGETVHLSDLDERVLIEAVSKGGVTDEAVVTRAVNRAVDYCTNEVAQELLERVHGEDRVPESDKYDLHDRITRKFFGRDTVPIIDL